MREACVRCGRLLHTGEGRVVIGFTAAEIAALVDATLDLTVRARLLCALTLLDPALAEALA